MNRSRLLFNAVILMALAVALVLLSVKTAKASDPDLDLNAPASASPDIEVNGDGSLAAIVYYKANTAGQGAVYLKSAAPNIGWRTRSNPLGFTSAPPKLAFTGPNMVYAVWLDGFTEKTIRYAVCTLSGASPADCPTIGTVYSSTNKLNAPALAIDSSGHFHLAWENVDARRLETLYLTSLAGLPVITPTDTIAPQSLPDRFTDPALAASASQVHLIFTSGDIPTTVTVDPQRVEIYRSALGGPHNWSNGKIYAIGNISTNFTRLTHPAIAANGARVFAAWDGYTTGKLFSLMGSESTDSGATWPLSPRYITSTNLAALPPNPAFDEQRVSSPAGVPSQEEGLRPSLALSGTTNFALAWQQRPFDSTSCNPNNEGALNGTSEIYLYEHTPAWLPVKHETPGDFDSNAIAPDVAIDPVTGEYHLAYMKATPMADDCTGGTDADDYAIFYQGPARFMQLAPTPLPSIQITLNNLQKHNIGLSSQYVVTNTSPSLANVDHNFYDSADNLVTTELGTIPANSSQTYDLASIAGLPEGYTGYVVIQSDQAITGAVLVLPQDTTPPDPIVGMIAASGGTLGTVDLTWIAPGDDGASGTASNYIVRYAASAITAEAEWAAATDVTGEPTPGLAGSLQQMTVSGLVAGQTYYFMVRAQDEVPNLGGLGNSASAVAGNHPPAAVTDLASTPGSGAGQINLTWTAPGDDGSGGGPAAQYDIRYSNAPIDESNWVGATQANGEPVPGTPGSTQQMTLSGLATGSRWYIALKTVDATFNWSALSNIPSLQEIGFRANPNGYSFPNWGGTIQENRNDFQIGDLIRMFGQAAVCQSGNSPCQVRPAAQQWYDLVINGMSVDPVTGIGGGHCDGFTTTGLRFFKGLDTQSSFQNGATQTYELTFDNLRRHIAYYWVLQVPNPVATARGQTLQNTPNQILDQLRNAMANQVVNPTTLLVYNGNRTSAHSITPYALQERSNGIWWVWVYDNNHPNDTNRRVQIDTVSNTWSYNLGGGIGTWSGDPNSDSLGAIPISVYAQAPRCPWCWGIGSSSTLQAGETSTWLNGSGHLLINDSQGRRIGYVGNQFVNEFPSAFGSVLPGGLGFSAEPIYHLPLSDTYTILLDGQTLTQTEVVSVTQFGPGYAASIDEVMLGSTSQGQITITPDGKQVTYQPDDAQEATLALALDGTSTSYKFQIANADIAAGQLVTMKADPDNQQVVFDNANAGGGVYDLEVECVGDTDTQVFAYTGINIRATDTHYAAFNASNCADSVTLNIDIGSQGVAFETVTLENQAPGNDRVYLPIIIK